MQSIPRNFRMEKMSDFLIINLHKNFFVFRSCTFFRIKRYEMSIKISWIFSLSTQIFTVLFRDSLKIAESDRERNLGQIYNRTAAFANTCKHTCTKFPVT